ncbi:MAG: Uma2 family endonuclease [Cyanobacteria bacterium P01_F01_bin.53]
MVQAPVEKLTLASFLALPETKPASEYINGKIIQKPMPGAKHSRLQCQLSMAINKALEEHKIASAFPELICTFGDRAIVPDISMFTWQRIPLDDDGDVANEFETHPDWIIEILSPGQKAITVINKILHALDHGTHMGWLIAPQECSILVCPKGEQPQSFEQVDERLRVPKFADSLTLTVGDIFGWLKF